MSSETRKIIKESNNILKELIHSGYNTQEMVSEAAIKGKLINLKEIEDFLNTKELSYYGQNKFSPPKGVLSVSLFMMPSKHNKLESGTLNCLKLDYSVGYKEKVTVSAEMSNAGLEYFMELPKVNHGKDKMSSDYVVSLCDASSIYNIYQDKALSIIRRMFSLPYHMFTGPNLYKTQKIQKGLTLYVRRDNFRKKFEYVYNPEFILKCAIEEWCLRKGTYDSLEDCYVYILAFVITHEMLHIVHHNSDVNGVNDEVTTGDHEVNNIVQDSFINCKIARRYLNVQGVHNKSRDNKSIAPIPSIGIGSDIVFRVQHNEGFRKFDKVRDLSDKILEVVRKFSKLELEVREIYSSDIDTEISKFEGCDLFIRVDISPTFTPLRNNGSSTFQRCIDDIVKVITGGKVYSKFTPISNAEKVSDLEIIPNGTLVSVRGTRDIAYVKSYDSDNALYTLSKSTMDGTDVIVQSDGSKIHIPKYINTFILYDKKKRREQIRPYDPKDDAYTEAKMPEQKKLTPEDLKKVEDDRKLQSMSEDERKKAKEDKKKPNGIRGQIYNPNEKTVKVFNVGDIVWVHSLKKFGRITAIDNGKFTLEEMIEKPAKVIDDSDNY